MSWKLECTPIDEMGIRIYDQVSFRRNSSEGKICRAFSLEFGLKRVQIAWNTSKFGKHTCISNRHPNIWSNFNYKNLVKRQIPSCSFAKVCLKRGENSSEHHDIWHALLSTKWSSKSTIKFNSEKLIKSETSLCALTKVALKGSENSSECRESWRAHLFIEMGI